ncbi:MAG: ATP-binding protein, partial [Polyangiaceae bacterium]
MIKDPYRYFRIEARELLDELSKGALTLEKSTTHEGGAVVVQLLRLAHTLKGAARVVKQRAIANSAHAIEDVLAPVRDEGATIDRAKIDAILREIDGIANALDGLAPPPVDVPSVAKLPIPGITELPLDRAPNIAETRTASGDVSHLLEGVTEVGVQLASLRTSLAELDQVSRLADILASQLSSPRMRANAELFGARSTMEDLRRALVSTERDLANALAQTDRELHDVREAAERLRLVPAGSMFAVLERTARDSAVSLGKRVGFDAEGGDVRLDADMLGVVQSALVQAVRNAVAHGIEPERDRANAGKNERGAILVSIVRAGRWVRFSCTDDGRGVDLTAVRDVAARRGATDVAAMTDAALLRHLLRGGISTSASVNEIAGRGVGLDVVSDAARRLGGDVMLDTKTGSGTTVTIAVPFSVAAVDALVVEANARVVAIPIEGVERAIRFHTEDLLRDAERASLLL